MNTRRILIVVGTRPNFIKVTRFKEAAAKYPSLDVKFVHTGQHFDPKMASIFFEQFGLNPDFLLEANNTSPVALFASIMGGLEQVMNEYKPNLIIVVGDVNSTLAAAITANKMGVKIAHLESGLRSFDRDMPEEINRILTDEITDVFFVTEQSGLDHLKAEGIPDEKVFFVGNTMIDSLVLFKNQIAASPVMTELTVEPGKFAIMTMHRPSNVDTAEGLQTLIEIILTITQHVKLVFPIHPRTIGALKKFGLLAAFENNEQLILTEPLDYFGFQNLVANSKFVVTDSGGIQEETTFLGVPCLTLRNNTERPITCTLGTNKLLEYAQDVVEKEIASIMAGTYKQGKVPPLWDGDSTLRIMEILNRIV